MDSVKGPPGFSYISGKECRIDALNASNRVTYTTFQWGRGGWLLCSPSKDHHTVAKLDWDRVGPTVFVIQSIRTIDVCGERFIYTMESSSREISVWKFTVPQLGRAVGGVLHTFSNGSLPRDGYHATEQLAL